MAFTTSSHLNTHVKVHVEKNLTQSCIALT